MANSQAALLSRLALAVAGEPESSPLTLRVCCATRDLLGAEGASITLENSTPNRVTLCATDEPADLLENLQDVLGEGPCSDAFDLGEPVETALDLSATGRWPQFIPAAEVIIGRDGVLYLMPMHAGGDVIGAVGLYRRQPGPLVEPLEGRPVPGRRRGGRAHSRPAGIRRLHRPPPKAGGWSSRAQIHQATGSAGEQAPRWPSAKTPSRSCGRMLSPGPPNSPNVAAGVVERKTSTFP